MINSVKHPNQFDFYDIACATLVMLPVSVASGVIAAGMMILLGGLS